MSRLRVIALLLLMLAAPIAFLLVGAITALLH